MSLKFINSGGKQYLIVNSFKFRENRTLANGNISWRCCVKDCKSWVKTDNIKGTVLNEKHQHKHKTQCSSPLLNSSTPNAGKENMSVTRSETSLSQSPKTAPNSPLTLTGDPTSTSTTTNIIVNQSSTPSPCTASTKDDLIDENCKLKAEIANLRSEMKVVLDHSIESDQRLLLFTNDVFSAVSPSLQKAETHGMENESMADIVLQAEQLKQEVISLKQDLKAANSKIRQLEETLSLDSLPCGRCAILIEETKNMVVAIEILEAEIRTLKQTTSHISKERSVNSVTDPTSLSLSNKFDPLLGEEYKEDEFRTITYKKSTNSKQKYQKEKSSKMAKSQTYSEGPGINKNKITKFRSVTIIGDSHARHLAKNISNDITSSTKVTGVCKANAGLLEIAPTSSPPPDHCYVLLGGTNDVDAGNQGVIYDYFEDILRQCGKKSKILVCPLLQRYDMPANSPIHEITNRVNRHISRICSLNENAELLDFSDLDRRHFTLHGLHLRASGKRFISNIIVERLANLTPAPWFPDEKEATSNLGPQPQDVTPSPPRPRTLPFDNYAEAVSQPPSQNNSTANKNTKPNISKSSQHNKTQSFLELRT